MTNQITNITRTFNSGDRVCCRERGRYNGTIECIMCGICIKCNIKKYAECVGDFKYKAIASFYENGTLKRFKYNTYELDLEPPLPQKEEPKAFDLSPKDIRPLGEVEISIPLIVPDGEEMEEEDDDPVLELVQRKTNRPIVKPAVGISLDQFLDQGWRRPI